MTANAASGSILRQITGLVSGATHNASLYIRRRTGTGAVNLLNPNGGSNLAASTTGAWQRFDISGVTTTSANFRLMLSVSGDEVDIAFGQFEPGATATIYQDINTSGNFANAPVLTIGNSFALDAPFPGSIMHVKFSATAPTREQSLWMWEQEKELLRAGSISVLPDTGSLIDMAYDDATRRWVATSAANQSYWADLVRVNTRAVPAGSFSRIAAASGVELVSRATTSPGVDITMPSYNLREELVKRAEAAARLSRDLRVFDYAGGFTGNTTNGSNAIGNVAGLLYPAQYIGARVSGTGIPAGAVITNVSGSTLYMSALATATGTAVAISFLDFVLPVGMEAKAVLTAGALKQEGSTKDYVRGHDGFAERIAFGAAPGATAWVQIQATKEAA
jgi:hypothetical protein